MEKGRTPLTQGEFTAADFDAARAAPVVLAPQASNQWKAPQFVLQVRKELTTKLCGPDAETCDQIEAGGLVGDDHARHAPPGHRREVGQGGDGRPQLEGPAGARPRRSASRTSAGWTACAATTSTTARSSRWTTRRATIVAYVGSADPNAPARRRRSSSPGSTSSPTAGASRVRRSSPSSTPPASRTRASPRRRCSWTSSPTSAAATRRPTRTTSSAGPVRMRDALSFSLNIPAVKAGAVIGNDAIQEQAEAMGIQFQNARVDAGLSFALGVEDVHPLRPGPRLRHPRRPGPARGADHDPHGHRQHRHRRRSRRASARSRPTRSTRARPTSPPTSSPATRTRGRTRSGASSRSTTAACAARPPSRPAPATRRATSTPTASSPRPTTAAARTTSTRWSSARGTATRTTRWSAAAADRCSRSTSRRTCGRASWRRRPRAGRSTPSRRPTTSSARRVDPWTGLASSSAATRSIELFLPGTAPERRPVPRRRAAARRSWPTPGSRTSTRRGWPPTRAGWLGPDAARAGSAGRRTPRPRTSTTRVFNPYGRSWGPLLGERRGCQPAASPSAVHRPVRLDRRPRRPVGRTRGLPVAVGVDRADRGPRPSRRRRRPPSRRRPSRPRSRRPSPPREPSPAEPAAS